MSKLAKIIAVIKDEVGGTYKRSRLYRKIIKSLEGSDFSDCFGIDIAFDEAFKSKDERLKESDD
jgi:hypothetical protein